MPSGPGTFTWPPHWKAKSDTLPPPAEYFSILRIGDKPYEASLRGREAPPSGDTYSICMVHPEMMIAWHFPGP